MHIKKYSHSCQPFCLNILVLNKAMDESAKGQKCAFHVSTLHYLPVCITIAYYFFVACNDYRIHCIVVTSQQNHWFAKKKRGVFYCSTQPHAKALVVNHWPCSICMLAVFEIYFKDLLLLLAPQPLLYYHFTPMKYMQSKKILLILSCRLFLHSSCWIVWNVCWW